MGLSLGKKRPGMVLTNCPLLAPRSRECRAIPPGAFESVTGYLYLFTIYNDTSIITNNLNLILLLDHAFILSKHHNNNTGLVAFA
jgi:hypothetical protein